MRTLLKLLLLFLLFFSINIWAGYPSVPISNIYDEAFLAAFKKRDLPAIKRYLAKGANPAVVAPFDLVEVVYEERFDITDAVLNAGGRFPDNAYYYLHDRHGQGGCGSLKAARYLLAHGVKPANAENEDSGSDGLNGSNIFNDLPYESHDSCVDFAKFLLENGARPLLTKEYFDKWHGRTTPLLLLARGYLNNPGVFQAYLPYLNPNKPIISAGRFSDWTPMNIAIFYGDVSAVKYFISRGAVISPNHVIFAREHSQIDIGVLLQEQLDAHGKGVR